MPQDLQTAFYAQGQAYHVKQVHGDRLINISDININDQNKPEADGIFALATANTSLWTCSADCVPALIGDRKLGMVAAVHAGWRGTAQGILTKAIALFQAHGSDLVDLVIALGPAISGESYQVQSTVAEQVTSTIQTKVGVQPDSVPDHVRLDIRLVQHQQLIEIGLDPSQIAIAPYCTFQTPDLFFSYRRYTTVEMPNKQLLPDQPRRSPQIQWSGIVSSLA
jgi:polyphenol oxidase